MSQSDDAELRSHLHTLIIKAAEIGAALGDDGPSELGDFMAAKFLAGLDDQGRSQMRIIFRQLRQDSDRGFSVIDKALRRPVLRVVGE